MNPHTFELNAKLLIEANKIMTQVNDKKQKLINIVLSNDDDETKIQNICRTLLEFQIVTNDTKNDNDLSDTLSTILENASVDDLQIMGDMMKRMFQPVVEQNQLFGEIRDILKSTNNNTNIVMGCNAFQHSDFTAKDKISKISILLI